MRVPAASRAPDSHGSAPLNGGERCSLRRGLLAGLTSGLTLFAAHRQVGSWGSVSNQLLPCHSRRHDDTLVRVALISHTEIFTSMSNKLPHTHPATPPCLSSTASTIGHHPLPLQPLLLEAGREAGDDDNYHIIHSFQSRPPGEEDPGKGNKKDPWR